MPKNQPKSTDCTKKSA